MHHSPHVCVQGDSLNKSFMHAYYTYSHIACMFSGTGTQVLVLTEDV
jgi:hypothetical protein